VRIAVAVAAILIVVFSGMSQVVALATWLGWMTANLAVTVNR